MCAERRTAVSEAAFEGKAPTVCHVSFFRFFSLDGKVKRGKIKKVEKKKVAAFVLCIRNRSFGKFVVVY